MTDLLLQSGVVTKKVLHEVLKQGREDAGLTQTYVAEDLLGKTQQAVQFYEAGRRIPNLVDLGIMGKAYGLDPSVLGRLQKEAKAHRQARKHHLPKGASTAERTIMQLRMVIDALSQQVDELAEAVAFLKGENGTAPGRRG